MTLQECIEFCNSHQHVIGSNGEKSNMPITHLLPAPTGDIFENYVTALCLNRKNYKNALLAIGGGTFNYEPLLLFDSGDQTILLHKWYFREFRNEKQIAK